MNFSSKRGGILIYTLGIILLLSTVITQFLLSLAQDMRLKNFQINRDDLLPLAQQSLHITLHQLYSIALNDSSLISPLQGWNQIESIINKSLPDGYSATLSISDESAKLPISSPSQRLSKLLSKLDIPNNDAISLSQNIQAFLSKNPAPIPDGLFELSSSLSSSSSSKKLLSYHQLKSIPLFSDLMFNDDGSPNQRYTLFSENISLVHSGKVNINTAPPSVRDLFLQASASTDTSAPLFFRSKDDISLNSSYSILDDDFDTNSSLLNLSLKISRGPTSLFLNFLLEFNSKTINNNSYPAKTPFSILAISLDNPILNTY